MGPFALHTETNKDLETALEDAVRQALALRPIRAYVDEFGLDSTTIVNALNEDHERLLAVSGPIVSRLERTRRARSRVVHQSPSAWEWSRNAAVDGAVALQQALRPSKVSAKTSAKASDAASRSKVNVQRQGNARHVEPGALADGLEGTAEMIRAELTQRLMWRVVVPHIRREVNEKRRDQADKAERFADEVDLTLFAGRGQGTRPTIDTAGLDQLKVAVDSMVSGAIGVAGPRQVGKTSALKRREHAFKVEMPAPTEYVAHEFLLRLANKIATEWIRRSGTANQDLRQRSARLRMLARTVTAVLPAILFGIGLWRIGSYVVDTQLTEPGESVAVVVGLGSVMVAGLIGWRAGYRLYQSLDARVTQDVNTSPNERDQQRDTRRGTWAGRVGVFAGTLMTGLAAAVLLVDAYVLVDWLTRPELAATLLVVLPLVGALGAYLASDFRGKRDDTSPVAMGISVVVGVTMNALFFQGAFFVVLPDYDLAVRVVLGSALMAAALCGLTLRQGIREADGSHQPSKADRLAEELRARVAYERSRATDTTTGVTVDLKRLLPVPVDAKREVKRSVTETERALTTGETAALIRELLTEIHRELTFAQRQAAEQEAAEEAAEHRNGKPTTAGPEADASEVEQPDDEPGAAGQDGSAERDEDGGATDEVSTVLITIDEVDKLQAGDKACEFLNELKAVFGVDGVVFLVAVSEDTRASHEKRGLAFRDAFDSAFDEVVHLRPFTFRETEQLLMSAFDPKAARNRRAGDAGDQHFSTVPVLPQTYTAVAHCLAGGLPGDVQRIFGCLDDEKVAGKPTRLADATAKAIHRELRAMWKSTVSALRLLQLEPLVSELIVAMHEIEPCPEDGEALPDCFLKDDPLAKIDRIGVAPAPDGEASAERQALARLVGEYVGFVYLCRTLMDFLVCEDEQRLERMSRATENSYDRGSIDYLARARHQLAATPRLGWQAIGHFRSAHGLGTPRPYPDGLYGVGTGAHLVVPDSPAALSHVGPAPKWR